MKNNYLILVVVCFLLSACGGGGGHSIEVHATDPVPTIVSFDLVDSFGVDTAVSNRALEIDPFTDGGLFDLRWRVNSLEDYEVNIRVNSRPDVNNSILIYSDLCGAGLKCDQGDELICQYTADYYLSCGGALKRDIKGLPQDVYLMLEICDLDSSYCVYRDYPVSML
ncbi:MAG: hypothetical protein EOO52_05580 [Gammaproteobacteria bacterium]|nr:MAG: hypothetical protein EOO52_05580 [Gammaproteobacteria bacterium]